MLKKLLANKKLIALIVALIVIIVGVVATVIHQDSKETGKSDISIETGKNKEETQENDYDKDEPYSGTGLEIMEEVDGTVDSVDASGNWDGTSGDNNENKQDNTTDDTQSDNMGKEESDDQGNEEEPSDEDILIDDKEWTEPS